MRSWSVPNAAMEPTSPLSSATQTMLGSVRTRCPKSGAPGTGPQLTTVSRPASRVRRKRVGRRDVGQVEGGDEKPGDPEPGEARADEELHVLAVLAVRGRGHGDVRDGADLGGQEAEARGPPGDPAAGEEEVDRVVLALREGEADRQKDNERTAQNSVVRPGEHGLL